MPFRVLDPGKCVFLSFARGVFGRADPGYRYFSPFARGVFWFLTLANAFIYRLPGVFSGEATLAIDTFRHLPGVFPDFWPWQMRLFAFCQGRMRHFRPWLSTLFAICQGHTRIFHPWQIQYSIDCQGRVRFCHLVSLFLVRCFHSIINFYRSAVSLAWYVSLRPVFSTPVTSSTVLRLQKKKRRLSRRFLFEILPYA